jgi:hypothetical protein
MTAFGANHLNGRSLQLLLVNGSSGNGRRGGFYLDALGLESIELPSSFSPPPFPVRFDLPPPAVPPASEPGRGGGRDRVP